MKKFLFPILALAISAEAFAVMNGQILNCDAPDPTQPASCVDNWALDLLDESKTAIQSAPGALPRDRKHYFDGTGAGVHIFMFDSGVDGTNPDFKVLDNAASSRLGVSYNNLLNVDGNSGSHGTRTAALAAGLQYGVAKGATIHAIYSSGSITNTGGDDLLDRLNWVYAQVTHPTQPLKPAVLNMSFNIPRPVKNTSGVNVEADLTQKVRDLINAGVVVTVSAGNQNSNNPGGYWPSVIPEVILVGGVDENGNRWVRDGSDPEYASLCTALGDCGSNYGALVDIWAPAKNIRSAVKKNTSAPRIRSGTSFAAPLVAGLAALYLQQNPLATPTQVLNSLLTNSANLGDIDGDGIPDFLARSPVAVPACKVTQRLFVNTGGQNVAFQSADLRDSCPAGYDAEPQYNAANGQIGIGGIGPNNILYRYTPNTNYTGNDQFNYNIYTSTGSLYDVGLVKVMVQPNHN